MVNRSIDLAAAGRHGITVCGTNGSAGSTAELAFGLILALARHIPDEAAGPAAGRPVAAHGRRRSRRQDPRDRGTRAPRARGSRGIGAAFDMTILAWSPNLTPERAAAGGALRVDTEELFRRADVVTLHMGPEPRPTGGLVGAREIAVMKRTAFLVNTSRGPLVEEAALVAALGERRDRGRRPRRLRYRTAADRPPFPPPAERCGDAPPRLRHTGHIPRVLCRHR